jgi:hypothetical protein
MQSTGERMTVAELLKKLDGLDPKTHIVVNRETDAESKLFEITNIAICTGESFRDEKTHEARFRAIHNGPARWLFFDIEEA